ncbi:unnamed protein product [Durusdinium trenchii]|uniref:Uncharacterized protein n=1 Tax=Durusdinium trenchii TaxID=1381693 RepID=A0ABP0KJF6_9DINO
MSNILPHVVPLRSFTVILPAASQIHRQDGQGARQFGTSRKGEESDAKNGQGGEEEGWKCLAEVSKAEVATSRWRVTVNRGAWPGSPCKSELEPWVTPQSFASKEPPVFMWASRCRRAVLLVDGKETLKEVRFRFELLGKDSSAAPDVLAVGQKGTLLGLQLLATHFDGKLPLARLEKVEEEVVLAHAGPGFKVKGYHNYRLNFLEKERWLDVSVQKSWPSAAEDKLRVANNTTVMPLAKAVAARQKALPEGGALLLEIVCNCCGAHQCVQKALKTRHPGSKTTPSLAFGASSGACLCMAGATGGSVLARAAFPLHRVVAPPGA